MLDQMPKKIQLFGGQMYASSAVGHCPCVKVNHNFTHANFIGVRCRALPIATGELPHSSPYLLNRDLVPEGTTVGAHTGSGNQTVEGVRGNADLESASGNLRLARLTGDLHFQIASGKVRARQISGPATAESENDVVRLADHGSSECIARH
jgi:hypothetical protein